MVFGLSRSVAYSLLSVTADDALRYAMGEDVGYKQNAKNHILFRLFSCAVDITRELVNIFRLKMALNIF